MIYKEIEGDLIKLAKEGAFDVIAHGCNCFCTMKRGIAPQMVEAFKVDKYPLEQDVTFEMGNIIKLGNIEAGGFKPVVVNMYTQYHYHMPGPDGIPLNYEALSLCLHKLNHKYAGGHIGLPQIGCGLAGGDWSRVKSIIQKELNLCDVTVVIYNSK